MTHPKAEFTTRTAAVAIRDPQDFRVRVEKVYRSVGAPDTLPMAMHTYICIDVHNRKAALEAADLLTELARALRTDAERSESWP